MSESLLLEFDLSGQLIKDRSRSLNTFKKERAIIDSLLHKFPKISFDKTKIDSTTTAIKFYSKIDFTIIEAENGTLKLEKYKRSLSKGMAFHEIDEFPVFKNCDSTLDNASLKRFMEKGIRVIISENFNTNLTSDIGLSPGVQRIYVNFTISKTGEIIDIRARGNHPALEKEAKRVIGLIPAFDKPGYYGKEPVDVMYSLPIAFRVSD